MKKRIHPSKRPANKRIVRSIMNCSTNKDDGQSSPAIDSETTSSVPDSVDISEDILNMPKSDNSQGNHSDDVISDNIDLITEQKIDTNISDMAESENTVKAIVDNVSISPNIILDCIDDPILTSSKEDNIKDLEQSDDNDIVEECNISRDGDSELCEDQDHALVQNQYSLDDEIQDEHQDGVQDEIQEVLQDEHQDEVQEGVLQDLNDSIEQDLVIDESFDSYKFNSMEEVTSIEEDNYNVSDEYSIQDEDKDLYLDIDQNSELSLDEEFESLKHDRYDCYDDINTDLKSHIDQPKILKQKLRKTIKVSLSLNEINRKKRFRRKEGEKSIAQIVVENISKSINNDNISKLDNIPKGISCDDYIKNVRIIVRKMNIRKYRNKNFQFNPMGVYSKEELEILKIKSSSDNEIIKKGHSSSIDKKLGVSKKGSKDSESIKNDDFEIDIHIDENADLDTDVIESVNDGLDRLDELDGSDGYASDDIQVNMPTMSMDRSLCISGLCKNVRAMDLQNVFQEYGRVIGTKILLSSKYISPRKIYGYVRMETIEQCNKCIENSDKLFINKKKIITQKVTDEMTIKRKIPLKLTEIERTQIQNPITSSDNQAAQGSKTNKFSPESTNKIKDKDHSSIANKRESSVERRTSSALRRKIINKRKDYEYFKQIKTRKDLEKQYLFNKKISRIKNLEYKDSKESHNFEKQKLYDRERYDNFQKEKYENREREKYDIREKEKFHMHEKEKLRREKDRYEIPERERTYNQDKEKFDLGKEKGNIFSRSKARYEFYENKRILNLDREKNIRDIARYSIQERNMRDKMQEIDLHERGRIRKEKERSDYHEDRIPSRETDIYSREQNYKNERGDKVREYREYSNKSNFSYLPFEVKRQMIDECSISDQSRIDQSRINEQLRMTNQQRVTEQRIAEHQRILEEKRMSDRARFIQEDEIYARRQNELRSKEKDKRDHAIRKEDTYLVRSREDHYKDHKSKTINENRVSRDYNPKHSIDYTYKQASSYSVNRPISEKDPREMTKMKIENLQKINDERQRIKMEFKMLEENRKLYEQNLKMKLDAHSLKKNIPKEGGLILENPNRSNKRKFDMDYCEMLESRNPISGSSKKSNPSKRMSGQQYNYESNIYRESDVRRPSMASSHNTFDYSLLEKQDVHDKGSYQESRIARTLESLKSGYRRGTPNKPSTSMEFKKPRSPAWQSSNDSLLPSNYYK